MRLAWRGCDFEYYTCHLSEVATLLAAVMPFRVFAQLPPRSNETRWVCAG